MKTGLRKFCDQELSLRVMNEEYLYFVMLRAVEKEKFSIIRREVEEFFTYSKKQLEGLRESYQSEVDEKHKRELKKAQEGEK